MKYTILLLTMYFFFSHAESQPASTVASQISALPVVANEPVPLPVTNPPKLSAPREALSVSTPYWTVRAGSTIGRQSLITVTDAGGRLWYERTVPSGEIVSFGGDFPDGVYFIRIKNGNKIRLVKATKSSD